MIKMKMKKILIVLVALYASVACALEWNTCCAYITRDDANAKWLLQDDGQGVYIREWSSTVAKPTEAELQAVEADAIDWMLNKTKDTEANYDEWDAKMKALIKLMVIEINKLRVKNGDAPYTKEQIKAALKAEM